MEKKTTATRRGQTRGSARQGGELHLSNAWRKNGQEMTAPMGSTVGDADPLLVERENSR